MICHNGVNGCGRTAAHEIGECAAVEPTTLAGYFVELDANDVPTVWRGQRTDPYPRAVVSAWDLRDDPAVWDALVAIVEGGRP